MIVTGTYSTERIPTCTSSLILNRQNGAFGSPVKRRRSDEAFWIFETISEIDFWFTNAKISAFEFFVSQICKLINSQSVTNFSIVVSRVVIVDGY